MAHRILIADDDPRVREALVVLCEGLGHRAFEAGSGRETLEIARRVSPDVVFLDIEMPEGSGLEVLPELARLSPKPQVVMVTGVGDVRTAVAAMREGAVDFLEKPVGRDLIEGVLERVLRGLALTRERDLLRGEVARLRSGPIIGQSRAIERVIDQVQRVASTPRTTVLVTGESGVGKELVARAVHENSARCEGPFVALNCAALAENLLEAELFGYEPGAFSGAHPKGHEGLIAAAEGGTLFLDEIGELAPEMQAKLLRVLQERVYRRVGGSEDRHTEVRFVASTNRDLGRQVEVGAFREDLFYRLNVLSIVVPPLRERREDVPELALHFLELFRREFGREYTGFEPEALEALVAHPWKGNIRELRNAIERGALRTDGGDISRANLGLEDGPVTTSPTELGLELATFSLRGMEEQLIRRALVEAQGNRSRTARMLGVNRTTLYNKLRVYQIEG
jgi:DNA-binding NtrC family response regulator